ncbi:MAG TPA: type 4a pilus biogenesis protein PilO, partial [Egibacteraceae bacterium]|nr:type 4a pilus biogenesis protein PilO [Egibacteraceae bacterium]
RFPSAETGGDRRGGGRCPAAPSQQAPLRREIKGLEEAKEREAELRETLRLLERLIPSDPAQPSLLVELQRAAEGAGVELVSVTFGEPEVPKGAPASYLPGTVLAAMPVTVIVDGEFLRITDFLRRVEVLDRAVLVGTLALTGADAGFPQLRGAWSGQAYALMPADDPLLVDPNAPHAPAAASADEPQRQAAVSPTQPQGSR